MKTLYKVTINGKTYRKEFAYFFEAWIHAMNLPIYSVIIGPDVNVTVQPKLSN